VAVTGIRPPAHAGAWYPGTTAALTYDVDSYLAMAGVARASRIDAIVAPHAGLMFSGRIGAHAYKTAAQHQYDVALLVGPSHYYAFDGVAVWPDGGFDSPLGVATIHAEAAAEILADPVAQLLEGAHGREHSLELQLPFLRRLLPDVPIVPMLMGLQQRNTIESLARVITTVARRRRTLLVASTDLSHFFDAAKAATLDARVQQCVAAFDPDALLELFEHYPEHERGRYVACGGGPAIAVMQAARALGSEQGRVLKYGHSGEVSGDNTGVVGYLAAAFGSFTDAH
jgi:AmmeMemoRadiSam system protein B